MAVNYADKVSAVKAVSQKTRLVEVPIKFQEKTEESALNSPSTSPLGEEQKPGVKVGLGCENAVKAGRLILRRAIVTLMIRRVYFAPSGLTDPGSLWSGFKEAEDYISFVCLLGGEKARRRDLVLGAKADKGIFWSYLPNRQKTGYSLRWNIDFSSPVHFVGPSILKQCIPLEPTCRFCNNMLNSCCTVSFPHETEGHLAVFHFKTSYHASAWGRSRCTGAICWKHPSTELFLAHFYM